MFLPPHYIAYRLAACQCPTCVRVCTGVIPVQPCKAIRGLVLMHSIGVAAMLGILCWMFWDMGRMAGVL